MSGFDVKATADPIALLQAWLKEAAAKELNDPNAAALATATQSGAPSVRMVLIKQADNRGFSFYTNEESQKGIELAANPKAAICFHWKSLRRQVRAEGIVSQLSPEDADEYFQTRNRASQLGALASQQSRLLESREALERRVKELAAEFPREIPRPVYWRGYILYPERIEFWQDGAARLHDRISFSREDSGRWLKTRLFP
jgi:pyridoxamine 5'-phosphate oxidase